jgi:hypothetical protein
VRHLWGPSALPNSLRIEACYPNPFHATASVLFSSPSFARIRIDILDTSGRHIRTLFDRDTDPGEHLVVWHGESDGGQPVAAGIYCCRIRSGSLVHTRKLVLVR